MITRDLLVAMLSGPDDEGRPRIAYDDACRIADSCLNLFNAEADEIRREILHTAAERISPSQEEHLFGGAPWNMGFHDGKSVAADALRLMARQY
ncbi:hypothetical protein SAMN05421595_1125 [Austwickia chelonae]|uniref:Uncharacterized protein n=1 Tax=Austwickia chelonae NBRC 105200 TaxID=1184607 RepID=K6V526_9MICO|nr:hypothetical protein [Austwickia chelonae]GAB77298.1 hypothetical protein AUCHE_05_02030 [Austwickia chelonae NBRC 105200]SEW07282.1 hypothetical protein SAMN05421595_1125 [Austwickia chelonae]